MNVNFVEKVLIRLRVWRVIEEFTPEKTNKKLFKVLKNFPNLFIYLCFRNNSIMKLKYNVILISHFRRRSTMELSEVTGDVNLDDIDSEVLSRIINSHEL